MTKMLVLYYSSYGHVEQMAYAQAEGARARCRAPSVIVKRVPELVSDEVARSRQDEGRPAGADRRSERARATTTASSSARRRASETWQRRCATSWTRPAALWFRHALVGKVGSVFTCTASQHGGQETTITSFHTTLLHFGMVIIGLPYTLQGSVHHARGDRRHALRRQLDHRRRRRGAHARARSSSTCASTRANTSRASRATWSRDVRPRSSARTLAT